MKKLLLQFILFLLASDLNALELKVTGKPSATPSKEDTTYFGWVEGSRAYIDSHKETVFEFYCHKLQLVDNQLVTMNSTIYVFPSNHSDEHFVATIKSPNISLQQAQDFLKDMTKEVHYCHYQNAHIAYEGTFADKPVPFLVGESPRVL